jgi:hypothetical protein
VRFFVVIPPAKAGGNSSGGNSTGGNSAGGNSAGGNSAGGNSVGYLESYYICLTSRYNFILLLT